MAEVGTGDVDGARPDLSQHAARVRDPRGEPGRGPQGHHGGQEDQHDAEGHRQRTQRARGPIASGEPGDEREQNGRPGQAQRAHVQRRFGEDGRPAEDGQHQEPGQDGGPRAGRRLEGDKHGRRRDYNPFARRPFWRIMGTGP
jgi:hypothetical protein